MNKLDLAGVLFRPISYKANYGVWLDKILRGVQIHFTDISKVNLLDLQFYFMQVHNKLYPEKKIFQLADSTRIRMFDKVMGTDQIRKKFTQKYLFEDVEAYLKKDIISFRELSKKYYLYN